MGDVIIINLKIPSFRQTQMTGEEDITLRNQGKNGKSWMTWRCHKPKGTKGIPLPVLVQFPCVQHIYPARPRVAHDWALACHQEQVRVHILISNWSSWGPKIYIYICIRMDKLQQLTNAKDGYFGIVTLTKQHSNDVIERSLKFIQTHIYIYIHTYCIYIYIYTYTLCTYIYIYVYI